MNKRKLVLIIMNCVISLSAFLGTFLSYYAGRHSFMGGTSVFLYFTIQSNIAVGILSVVNIIWILKNKDISNIMKIIELVSVVSISLTGFVFCFVLAPTFGKGAWNIQNILTHVVVPVVSIIEFFVLCEGRSYQTKEVLWVILPPLFYAIFAGIGYILKWEFSPGINYPYFFLNWGSEAGAFGFCNGLPFMGCMWWIIALLLFLILIGILYSKLVSKLKK